MTLESATLGREILFPSVERRRWKLFRAVSRFARRQPLGFVAALVIIALVAAAILAPYLHTVDPTAFGRDLLKGPSAKHWFGTNRQGRDVYSRVVYGSRVSLQIGVSTVVLSVAGGTLLALVAGFMRGPIDSVIMRGIDLIMVFPSIIFALAIATSIGAGITSLVIAISVVFTPVIARVMRGAVLQERSAMYVEAAEAIGASHTRIMFRHILPNITSLMIVVGSATLPAAILTEASLSFLGVGIAPGEPSWGADLGGDSRRYFVQAWWIAVAPGAALSLCVLAFNLLGDSLRAVLDPRLRGTGLG